jgi:hypothetical protein
MLLKIPIAAKYPGRLADAKEEAAGGATGYYLGVWRSYIISSVSF